MKGNENRISGWYQRWDLNPRPPTYEAGALNQLSYSGISREFYAEFSLKGFLVYPSEPKVHQCASMLATPRGLEPLTSGVTGRRSNQLNYEAIKMVRLVQGSHQAPVLGYTIEVLAASTGIEPAISSVTDWRALRCSTKLYKPF